MNDKCLSKAVLYSQMLVDSNLVTDFRSFLEDTVIKRSNRSDKYIAEMLAVCNKIMKNQASKSRFPRYV